MHSAGDGLKEIQISSFYRNTYGRLEFKPSSLIRARCKRATKIPAAHNEPILRACAWLLAMFQHSCLALVVVIPQTERDTFVRDRWGWLVKGKDLL